jgi:hypothetical protein
VTAKTGDGDEVYSGSRTYMPIPQRFGRGDVMGRGPYEKSGLIEETSLPAGVTVTERFDFPSPGGSGPGKEAKPGAGEIEVAVRLFYLPFGTMDASPFLWREVVRTVPPGDGE